MNGYVYWKDDYTLKNPLPKDSLPQAIPLDVADIICHYFNAKYGEGEMIHFYIIDNQTDDSEWANYEGTVMDIFEEYHTRIEPVFFPWEELSEAYYTTPS